MKISIINGSPCDQNYKLDKTVSDIEENLKNSGHAIQTFILRDLNILYCEGCLNCFIKTPGECTFVDDSHKIRYSYINSDFVLLVSPVILGFTSALLKKAIDKLVPLVHPYFNFSGYEVHHKKRYSVYPKLGVLLEDSDEMDEEDFEIIKGIYSRNALNLKTSISFIMTTLNPVKEIIYAINSI